jgi:hypothetical protein
MLSKHNEHDKHRYIIEKPEAYVSIFGHFNLLGLKLIKLQYVK